MLSQVPLVSIIIPTRDSNPDTNLYLKLTLEGILLQSYPNIEIITVCLGLERSQQLNYGISKSHGQYILRLDDDWLLQPRAISESVHLIEDEQADFICINNIFLKSDNLLKEVKRIEREIITSNHTTYNLHIAGNFYQRKHLPNNPFPENKYANEEFALHDYLTRKHLKFKVAHSISIHLNEPSNWSTLFFKSSYYGRNLKSDLTHNPLHINPFRISYLKYLNHFNHPKLLFGFFLFKFIQYLGALIGMLLK